MEKKFKKIAVCLSGHMRTFCETAEILKYDFLDRIAESYDFFIYTTRRKDWRYKRGDDRLPPLLSDREIEFLYQVYNPKRIIIDGKDFNSVSDHNLDNGRNRDSMLGRLKLADMLRREYTQKTGQRYDHVLRMRPDQLVLVPFLNIDQIQPDKLAILPYGRVHDGFSDTFAMGPENLMEIYSEVVDHVDKYSYLGTHQDCKIELVLIDYLKDRNVPVYFLEGLQLLIKRINGEPFWFHDQPGSDHYFRSTGRVWDKNLKKFVECDTIKKTHKEIVELLKQ